MTTEMPAVIWVLPRFFIVLFVLKGFSSIYCLKFKPNYRSTYSEKKTISIIIKNFSYYISSWFFINPFATKKPLISENEFPLNI